jgi:hypothetical protein
MTDFLNSIKADLLERRMLALLIALGVAVIAAVAYAVLGGSTTSTPLPTPPPAVRAVGLTVSQAPGNPDQVVAETTNGSQVQRGGNARDPFAPLVAATKASPPASSKTTSSKTTTPKTGSGSPKGEAPAPAPSTPSKPSTPRVVIHFHVAAQFGALPPPPAPGAPPLPVQLKGYENLTIDQPLPAKNNPQLVFLGVVLPTGKSAVFALTGEAILHGQAKCLPSPTQCQAIDLLPGQSEQLETVDANNNPVTYELKLLSITKTTGTASAAKAHASFSRRSKAERELLRRAGLAVLPALKGTEGAGMLVFIGRRAHGARAGLALQRRHYAG